MGEVDAGEAPRRTDSTGEYPPRDRDDNLQRKRRRRRRGRGGRDRNDERPRTPQGESHEHADDDDLPFLELAGDDDLTEHGDSGPIGFEQADVIFEGSSARHDEERSADQLHVPDDLDDHDDGAHADADDHHSGKTTVRDIITWKDAIGMIIDGNMQTRANTPQHHSHNSRGPRGGGHGRGRGGRGGRGGGHRR